MHYLREQMLGHHPVNEAETFIKKMPPNTEVHDSLKWSKWASQLAIVTGPSVYDVDGSGVASKAWFDPAKMARRYNVRFATDLKGKRLPSGTVPDKELGYEIVIRDGSKQYWQTTWSIGRQGYGPVEQGSFEKKTSEFLVAVPLTKLGKAEMRAVEKLYRSYGYQDVGDVQTKLKKAQWKKLISYSKFIQTQDLDSDLANAAYGLLRMANGFKDPKDERDEQLVWQSIRGIFNMTKKGRITFLFNK